MKIVSPGKGYEMDRTGFYICLTCYRICEDSGECHEHAMLFCRPGLPGSERRKPMRNARGEILSRAPRLCLEETGWSRSQAPWTPLLRG